VEIHNTQSEESHPSPASGEMTALKWEKDNITRQVEIKVSAGGKTMVEIFSSVPN